MSIKQSTRPSKNTMIFKCWFCNREIPNKFKDKGAGICWRCGKSFKPNPSYIKPEFHKYCSKECRYPQFCDYICKNSFKKLLKKWHKMLDYTSYHYDHYNINKGRFQKIKLRICRFLKKKEVINYEMES